MREFEILTTRKIITTTAETTVNRLKAKAKVPKRLTTTTTTTTLLMILMMMLLKYN